MVWVGSDRFVLVEYRRAAVLYAEVVGVHRDCTALDRVQNVASQASGYYSCQARRTCGADGHVDTLRTHPIVLKRNEVWGDAEMYLS